MPETSITFFTVTPEANNLTSAVGVLRYLGAREDIVDASRSAATDESWALLEAGDEEIDFDIMCRRTSLAGLSEIYAPERLNSFQFFPAENSVSHDFFSALGETGEFKWVPGQLSFKTYVQVGFHDVYTVSENGPNLLFGRASLSVSFLSYGSPEDLRSFQRKLSASEAIRNLRASLNKITAFNFEIAIFQWA